MEHGQEVAAEEWGEWALLLLLHLSLIADLARTGERVLLSSYRVFNKSWWLAKFAGYDFAANLLPLKNLHRRLEKLRSVVENPVTFGDTTNRRSLALKKA